MLFLCSMKIKLNFFLMVALLSSVFAFAGEPSKTPVTRTVILSGKIMDLNSNEFLAGVKIECSNCEKLFYSDLDGKFFIALQVSGTEDVKLEFSQIGYDTKTLDIKELQVNAGSLYIDLQPE